MTLRNYRKQLFGFGILLVFLSLFYTRPGSQDTPVVQAELSREETRQLSAFPVIVPTMKWGFAIDTLLVEEYTVQNGQVLGELLTAEGMSYVDMLQLVENAKDKFDVRHFRVKKPYALLQREGSDRADYLVYEPNVYEYVVFNLRTLEVERMERPVEVRERVATGIIESSLWNCMVAQDLSFEVAAKMEDALQWSVDFHHLQRGDRFKLIFDEKYIDGERVGAGEVKAAVYENGENRHYAVWFEDTENPGYYDEEGRPMNKGFLKSPVKYSRISSGYNLRRFHPILKRTKPHYGTDYAAPRGTPILAVGNGVVTKASRTRGNGNFVKIKHDDTYSTQYLHMQKFATGITPGAQVKQGQVIGYVGSTGLATGPHVCFRFWKNGKQVNHLRLNFPPPAPLPDTDLPKFEAARDALFGQMDAIEFAEFEEVVKADEDTFTDSEEDAKKEVL